MNDIRKPQTEDEIATCQRRIAKARRRIARGKNITHESAVIDRLLLRLATLDTPWPSLESFMKRYTA